MANEIFTRLQLKYDTLANWNLVKDTFKPLAGEVCIAKVEVNDPANKLLDPVMIKVGDGTSTWGQLDWISAKAADVYAWAKKAGIDVDVEYSEAIKDEEEKDAFPITNLKWENNKLIVVKDLAPAKSIWFEGNGSSSIESGVNLEDLIQNMQYDIIGLDCIVAGLKNRWGEEIETVVDNDGSKTLTFIEDESFDGGGYSKAIDIAITHDQVTDFDTEVKSVAADEINRLINAADPEGGKTIQDIENLVKYVDENAGEIAGLITDVETAKRDAASAVATAGAANTTAGQALEKANQALEGATGAANSAAEAEAARAAAVVAQGKAEVAQAGAEAAQVKAEVAQTAAEVAQRAAADSAAAAEASNTSATAIANEAKGIAEAAKAASDAATEAVSGLKPIAFSGSIYDVAEGSVQGDVKYLVFNCGTASTVI